jgi:hypothetical protein
MKKRSSDSDLDRLLSRGKLGGAEKERILDSVLREHASDFSPSASPRRSLFVLRLAVVAAACLVAVLVPLYWYQSGGDSPTDPSATGSFQVRGAGSDSKADVSVGCDGSCRQGSVLMFRVGGLAKNAYVAAYAVGASGQRIWYFPSVNGVTPMAKAAATTPEVLKKGVLLGPEHGAGRYSVHVYLTTEALSRDQLRRIEKGDPRVLDYVSKTLTVDPSKEQ